MSHRVDKVLIMGLGLIGGSLARSLQQSGFSREVWAWGYRDVSLIKGEELGVIDQYSLDMDEALVAADIVVLGTPTLTCNELIEEVLPRLDSRTVITDVASVKGSLVRAYQNAREELLSGADKVRVRGEIAAGTDHRAVAPFVPGHPIAGSERSGVAASQADLFADHRVILTPLANSDPEALILIRDMWDSTGAEVVEMGVTEHDAILAATSHLPHVLAYALVDVLARSELSEDIFRFAAGGFRDYTRIASSDPVMWRDIALANRDALLKSIDAFSEHLAGLREAVANGDGDAMHRSFSAAKTARDAFTIERDQ